jgi:23S rRNA (guanosine2251-2'-O)-methyltransferase
MDWLYGRQVVRCVLAPGARRRAHRLAATPAAFEDLASAVPVAGVEQHLVDARELERLTGSRDHQGVAVLVGDYPYVSPDELAQEGVIVVLDEVTDPRNVGAVARCVLASGGDGLVLPRHRSAAITPAAAKASAGATERIRIAHVTNVASFLTDLKKRDFWVYGAAGEADTSFVDLDYSGNVALVFGSEGTGLRPLVARTCDKLAAIPMSGGPVDSLNVSVAAALFLFEARRRRS